MVRSKLCHASILKHTFAQVCQVRRWCTKDLKLTTNVIQLFGSYNFYPQQQLLSLMPCPWSSPLFFLQSNWKHWNTLTLFTLQFVKSIPENRKSVHSKHLYVFNKLVWRSSNIITHWLLYLSRTLVYLKTHLVLDLYTNTEGDLIQKSTARL